MDIALNKTKQTVTLSSLTLHFHLHPLQAANCCRNSRLVVDEEDLMWVFVYVLVNQFHEIFILKPLIVGKFSLFSGM